MHCRLVVNKTPRNQEEGHDIKKEKEQQNQERKRENFEGDSRYRLSRKRRRVI